MAATDAGNNHASKDGGPTHHALTPPCRPSSKLPPQPPPIAPPPPPSAHWARAEIPTTTPGAHPTTTELHPAPTCSTWARRVMPSTCSWSRASLSCGSAASASASACTSREEPLAAPAALPPRASIDADSSCWRSVPTAVSAASRAAASMPLASSSVTAQCGTNDAHHAQKRTEGMQKGMLQIVWTII